MTARFQVSPKAARTIDGITFDSRREATRYADLKILQRAGVIGKIELQPSFQVAINGSLFCRYTADFSYYCKETDRVVIEDVKSTGTARDAAYRLRKKAAELAYRIKITEVIA